MSERKIKPHKFVGIGAGELGMSACEFCGLLERDLIHSTKFRDVDVTLIIQVEGKDERCQSVKDKLRYVAPALERYILIPYEQIATKAVLAKAALGRMRISATSNQTRDAGVRG